MATASRTKFVYEFSEGSRDMRDLLGGKGANVSEMTRILGRDRVPAGFTITTEACVAYMNAGRTEPEGLKDQVQAALGALESQAQKRLGDADDPLLVSVRSGARASMPGMMDTVLNLGLNDSSVQGLATKTANERFAWDAYRRFVQMYANVCYGVPSAVLEEAIAAQRHKAAACDDTQLGVDDLRQLAETFKQLFYERTGEAFPQDPGDQLERAIRAVFDSWMGERAVEYRRLNHIPDSWGTAVNVQQMVFGNKGDTSCSGVAFSRDEITGAGQPSGDFLVNAQGEDVVSGVRTPQDLSEMQALMPAAHAELLEILGRLEAHYKDMQDTEFTVEEGRLYMLQTRNAKRPAQAAVRFAVDATSEGLLTREEAIQTIDANSLDALLHPTFSQDATYTVLARGVNASPGAAKGAIVFTAEDAVEWASAGRDVILVRPFTEADDISGFDAARGILTSEGGKASHAALVARGMGRPCVCGAAQLEVNLSERIVEVGSVRLAQGDVIAIDGTSGIVTTDDVALVDPEVDANFAAVLSWCDEIRRLEVRANADTPEDARKAREFGAQGIGLCRTEHMFMQSDRQPKMRAMIMADDESERRRALEALLPLQQQDFAGLFEQMAGLAVCIRLFDPPLHEFLPGAQELSAQLQHARDTNGGDVSEVKRTLDRVRALEETNPMLGTRGCRLGIIHPEIYEMQVKAIVGAALEVKDKTGASPHIEIMIPLVSYERELELMRELVTQSAARSDADRLELSIGTMIELPRACFTADRIAEVADFFSFGTNDLTQTGIGLSRDDVEGRFLARYIEKKIIDRSPFETIDRPGVGELVRVGAERGRKAKRDIALGICGEHGGDPESIAFFHEIGLDYVSCSAYRVPVARVAAAQAAIAT